MAAPFGQRVPSLNGLRGSPSTLTILPSTVCTRVAQPTEQYGQMLGTVLASLIRNSAALASVGAKLAPRPVSPPNAVPPATPAETRRKSRLDTSIVIVRLGVKQASRVPPCRTSRIARFISAGDRLTCVAHARRRRVDYARLADLRYQLRRFLGRRESAARSAGVEPQQYALLLQLKGLAGRRPATIGTLAERLQ